MLTLLRKGESATYSIATLGFWISKVNHELPNIAVIHDKYWLLHDYWPF
jgi:hypothetical protein